MTFRDLSASLVLAILVLAAQVPAARAVDMQGTFYGVDDAAGVSIEIQPDPEGFTGTFFDAHGNSQEFKADREGDSAQAVLDMDGRTVLMRVDPLPFGAEITIVPVDADGNLDFPAGRKMNFVRASLSLPQPGPEFVPAPRNDTRRIAANGFLASYEFWDPTGVRNGYVSLPDRFRTVMRLFPAVQLDVIWKLCLAPASDRALSLALRGQGVSCPEVAEGIAAAQMSGRFDSYKAEVTAQKAVLRMTVRCADGFPESKEDCDNAARELAAQAVTLDTAATVLERYR
ncbi:MAG TPA: hypothetical protein VLA52_04760 [Thermohalobaculum sp.]|nr:hypothetical protein [Thermohalobaculum sp.]